MLTPKSKHTEFEDDSCGNVEPVQSRRDHASHVASPRKHEDEACGSPHDTRQLTEKVFRSTAEEFVTIVKSRPLHGIGHGRRR